jgi:formyl-CoA transferase
MAALQGRRGGQPTVVKMALADKISGMTAALSIVSALHAARNRGVGQNIRIPMVEAMMAFTCNDTMVGYTFVPEDEYKDQAPKSQSLDPFPTKDGWISIAPFTDEQFERLCLGVGHHEWWTEVADRTERIRGILRGLAKTLPERTTAEWLEVLEKADVPVGRVNDYETLFTDEEVVANENFTLYEHPDAGTVRTVNPGARFTETPARMWRIPPRLGENTEEVLRELGVERSTIEELRTSKVIN